MQVTKEDGQPVQVAPAQGFFPEVKSVLLLFADPVMLLLTPLFVSSNWYERVCMRWDG